MTLNVEPRCPRPSSALPCASRRAVGDRCHQATGLTSPCSATPFDQAASSGHRLAHGRDEAGRFVIADRARDARWCRPGVVASSLRRVQLRKVIWPPSASAFFGSSPGRRHASTPRPPSRWPPRPSWPCSPELLALGDTWSRSSRLALQGLRRVHHGLARRSLLTFMKIAPCSDLQAWVESVVSRSRGRTRRCSGASPSSRTR